MNSRIIVIAGGTGFLGSSIIRSLDDGSTLIRVLTRRGRSPSGNIRFVPWDAKTPDTWEAALEGSDVLINLVGRSVNCRYTERNRQEILQSRRQATLLLGRAVRACSNPPRVWINAGSAAIFGDSGSVIKAEGSLLGEGFSPGVCKRWEQAFYSLDTPRTRKVLFRIGLVLQPTGGLLKPFIRLVKWGLGGKMGSGEQYISWIHEADFLSLIHTAIASGDFSGTIHAVSPQPVTNRDFLKALRSACAIRLGIPQPAFMLKCGARLIGTEAELLLAGRRVVSRILAEKHFVFQYPEINGALAQLLG